jgi:phage/plasmid-associated DNA primase
VYKNIVNTMNACKPMVAIDVSELDYDAELLNTPAGTYDLSKGLDGCAPHDPDDLITKITSCAPGDKGMKLWRAATTPSRTAASSAMAAPLMTPCRKPSP